MSQSIEGRATTRSAARAAGFVMAMIFVSRFIGFIREMTVARTFGRTAATDAFFAAFAIPDLMYYLLVGGALSSAFIPVFTEYLATGKEEEGWEAASTFINVALALLLLFTILGAAFAPNIASWVAYNFRGAQRDLLVQMMRFMFPAVFCTAVAGLQMGILHSYRHFLAPALGPIVYNIGIILGAALLGHRYGVKGMAVGVVFGAACNVLTQFPFVLKRNRGYRPIIDLKNPGYRRMIALMVPTLIGLSFTQLNLVINDNFASGLAKGSLTALRYADRLMQLPLGVFAMGISQAFFPTLTRQVARDEMADFRETFGLGLRSVFFVTIPAAVGLLTLREPIVRLLFQRGAFTAHDTTATAFALLFYSLGLVAASSEQVLTRVFYALHDTSTPVKTGILRVFLIFAMNLSFLRFTDLGHGGLALSFSIGVTANMLLLLTILGRRLHGLDARRLGLTLSKALSSALVMGAVTYMVSRGVAAVVDTSRGLFLLAQVGLSIAAGAAVYGGCAHLLNMEEMRMLVGSVRERFGRHRAPDPS